MCLRARSDELMDDGGLCCLFHFLIPGAIYGSSAWFNHFWLVLTKIMKSIEIISVMGHVTVFIV